MSTKRESGPIKYTDGFKQRTVELVLHAQVNPDTAHGAVKRVADELGVLKEVLRVWVRKHKDNQRNPLTSKLKTAGYGQNSRKPNEPTTSRRRPQLFRGGGARPPG